MSYVFKNTVYYIIKNKGDTKDYYRIMPSLRQGAIEIWFGVNRILRLELSIAREIANKILLLCDELDEKTWEDDSNEQE